MVFPHWKYEDGPFEVVVENGLISSIKRSPAQHLDGNLGCHLLSPGFVDIHNHGMGEKGPSQPSRGWGDRYVGYREISHIEGGEIQKFPTP